MKNADLPAMPLSGDAYHDFSRYDGTSKTSYNPECQGLTKREMFAMHAPECPGWYSLKFVSDNCQIEQDGLYHRNIELFDESMNLNFAGQMQLLKQWRYAYADLMLGDDNETA